MKNKWPKRLILKYGAITNPWLTKQELETQDNLQAIEAEMVKLYEAGLFKDPLELWTNYVCTVHGAIEDPGVCGVCLAVGQNADLNCEFVSVIEEIDDSCANIST